jgi:hypothetical protein
MAPLLMASCSSSGERDPSPWFIDDQLPSAFEQTQPGVSNENQANSFIEEPVQGEQKTSLNELAQQILHTPGEEDSGFQFGTVLEAAGDFSSADRSPGIPRSGRFNKIRMRSVEINGEGSVGDYADARFAIDMSDGGSGSDFILREATAWLNIMPSGYRLRVGKYFADVGSWNGVYLRDFPSPNLDGVRREFLGGNMAVTGAELHGGESEDGFRWSLGIATDVERQDPDEPENGTGRTVSLNRMGLKNWGASTRLQWGEPESVQFGTSAWFSPGEVWTADGTTEELQTVLLDVDASLPFLGGQLSGEIWMKRGETYDSAGDDRASATGYWGTWSTDLSTNWFLNALGSHWEHFRSLENNAGHYYSGSLGYRINDNQRLRLSLSHENPGLGWQKYYAIGFQWILNPTLFNDKK